MPIVSNPFQAGDRVQVRLEPGDAGFMKWNERTGHINHISFEEDEPYRIVADDNSGAFTYVSLDQIFLVDPVPAVRAPRQFKYTLVLQEHEYAKLMQLVMKYGTGTGEGISTPVDLRIALADAEVSAA